MKHVYILTHEYEASEGVDETKMIGVYSSKEKAEMAITRLITQPGFRDYKDCFNISKTTLDEDHWTEGFIRWEEAMSGPPKP
ncbi:DUF7336 domain-containing protein [Chondromyces crocatus]|uniref:DUF7336 domain-containing protein n=1 Tax=Chondromyces crocatus TaxID=52 RepID=A0A0K1ES38_CHOCO|nr:hypothetical protein [Chondromyces crocatus]AKT43472.1 uncharacterized protein CMC5_077040 [Chondromyces crocatus]